MHGLSITMEDIWSNVGMNLGFLVDDLRSNVDENILLHNNNNNNNR